MLTLTIITLTLMPNLPNNNWYIDIQKDNNLRNDTLHNDIEHNNPQHYDTECNCSSDNDTNRNYTQHNDNYNQHNDTAQ
jgi:hypothetical protein